MLIAILATTASAQNTPKLITSTGSPNFVMKIDGEEFFPLGAYISPSIDVIDSLKSNGFNVAISYWWTVVDQWCDSCYPETTPWPHFNIDLLTESTINYLNAIDQEYGSEEFYVILDVNAGRDEARNWGFRSDKISKYLSDLFNSNANKSRILGWYISDEPELSYNWDRDPQKIGLRELRSSPDSMVVFIDTIRAVENRFGYNNLPILTVISSPEYFEEYVSPGRRYVNNTSTYPTHTDCAAAADSLCWVSFDDVPVDILGWDSYQYNNTNRGENCANGECKYNDYNNISRLAINRGYRQTEIKDYSSLWFVGMIHDLYVTKSDSLGNPIENLVTPTQSEMVYQFFSPIIHGARGQLYFIWDYPVALADRYSFYYGGGEFEYTSTLETRQNLLDVGRFFTSNALNDVVTSGAVLSNVSVTQIVDHTYGSPSAISSPSLYKWQYYNNYGVVSNRYYHSLSNPNNEPDISFPLFNHRIFKYEGDYYLFAVNDFKNKILPSINITFDTNERIASITRLNPFGADEAFTSFTMSGNVATLQEMFDSYEVAILKIKTTTWSAHATGILPFNGVNGSDIAVYDFDNNGNMDVLHFSNVVIPNWADSFRVTSYWDLGVNGSNQTFFTNANSTNYPGDLFGKFPSNGVSWTTRGGGIGLYEFSCLDAPCGMDFFMLTNHTDQSTDEFRFKQQYDFTGSPTTAVNTYDVSYHTHPSIGRIDVPGISGNTVGTGMEVFDLDDSGKPEVILMGIDGDQTSVTQDFKIKIIPNYWAQGLQAATCSTNACPDTNSIRNYTIAGISNNSIGGDIAVGDLNGDGQWEMVVASVSMSHRDRIRYRIVGIDSLGAPQSVSPIHEAIFTGVSNIQSIGAAIADVNDDGLYDIIFSAITSDSNPPELLCETEYRDECELMEGYDITYVHIKVGLTSGSLGSYSKQLPSIADRFHSEDERPTEFAIRNYPNPFNPQTTFQYELPQDGHVRLDVFDMTGRLVTTLVDTNMPTGRHTATFDATRLSSGVYLYRISASGRTLTGKITLLK